MPTDRQRSANRANATHSTGPVTERGRAAVRSNALVHGFYSRIEDHFSLDPAACQAVLDDYLADYRPCGAAETELVQRIVRDLHKLRRFDWAETAYIGELVGGIVDRVSPKVTDPAARGSLAFQNGIITDFCELRGPVPLERFELLVHRVRRAVDKSTQLLCQLQRERLTSAFLAAQLAPSPPTHDPLSEPPSCMEPRPPLVGQDSSCGPTSFGPLPSDSANHQHPLGPSSILRAPSCEAAIPACQPPSQPAPSSGPSDPSEPPESPSETKSEQNVTTLTPLEQTPNPEIGFVPHKNDPFLSPPPEGPPAAA